MTGGTVRRPEVVVFDVNETLSDLSGMSERFAEVGLEPGAARTWFASVLRDGFALAVSGTMAPFSDLAEATLRSLVAGRRPAVAPEEAVAHVMEGFGRLGLHEDVPEGVRALVAAGFRLVTLSNGAAAVADRLLSSAGLREHFERLLSVEDAGVFKPARAAYDLAATTCRCRPEAMLLVAVHPWDVDGAARAGMQTALVDRVGLPYPPFFTPPGTTVASLPELAGLFA